MGTSAKNPGASPTSALVPSWLEDAPGADTPDEQPNTPDAREEQPTPTNAPRPPLPEEGDQNRFRSARRSFNKALIGSGRTDHIRRSVSEYVRTGLGGSHRAATRMSRSSRAAGRMIGFTQAVRERGFHEAIKEFGVSDLANKPFAEAVARITEAFCPPGGLPDDSLARSAWNDVLLMLVERGIADFEGLTADQWAGLVELFIARTIELRVINDLANDTIGSVTDVNELNAIQGELHDLIFGSVQGRIGPLIEGQRQFDRELQQMADTVYELAFAYLEELEGAE